MGRLTKEELEQTKQKYNTDRIWSWSRVSTYMTSKYEYMLKYLLNEKEDRCDSCYMPLGTICHDTLDAFYEGKIKYEDMIENYNDGFLTNITIAGLKFNRSDEEKNKSIGEKYNQNLIHFFNNHTVYEHKLLIEKPVVININGNIFVGYIDALFKNDEDIYHVIDFKSSSIYTGKTLEEHAGQLTLYALGLHQAGLPLNRLKAGFNFLKYCTIEYQLKNGSVKQRNVERVKLGESLQSNAATWLKAYGYEPDEYLMEMLDTNSIDCLPEEVKCKYKITDCHVWIDLSEKAIEKWIKTITDTITDIRLREQDYEESHNKKIFWDDEADVAAQSYYFSNLCQYSPNKLLPFKEYLDKLEAQKTGLDFFSGVGSALENNSTDKHIYSKTNELDLSWLENL